MNRHQISTGAISQAQEATTILKERISAKVFGQAAQ